MSRRVPDGQPRQRPPALGTRFTTVLTVTISQDSSAHLMATAPPRGTGPEAGGARDDVTRRGPAGGP